MGTQTASQAVPAPLPGAPPAVTPEPEHPRLRLHRDFPSQWLGRDRDVWVYLPPGYEAEPDRRYPVLYLQDGQNLFDPRTSFAPGVTWQVAETADAAIEAGEVEPLLIVGIANTGEHRLAEYSPTADPEMGGGEGSRYGQMMIRELAPFLMSRYRVLAGPEHTGVGGSSMGGLISLYLGLKFPGFFGRLAVLSPSVWWDRKWILRCVEETGARVSPKPRIWLDAGDAEGSRTLENTRALAERLRAAGWQDDVDLDFEAVPGGRHDEASWAVRVGPMLRFLFPAG
ncbi:alpha/beta hydrolase [Silvibacterium dinghuense]|uniref:alpha/beta hydrolase n=1 Tax=Silvibacterium dinghuense TaxID=1560006 RepID=UPI0013E9732B|nr:alpha/beta hydrolase-fold protein [Silvibacterium dinghuense]